MKMSTNDMTRVALFSALICVASLVLKIGGDVLVPFSILPFMIMLAGGVLGPKLGAISVSVYVLIGLLGVPVFAKAPYGGFMYVLQPTFGFLLGFIASAWIVGMFLRQKPSPGIIRYLIAMLLGIIVYYLIGIPYLFALVKIYLGKPFSIWKAIQTGMLPFIALDLLKGVMAAIAAKSISRRIIT